MTAAAPPWRWGPALGAIVRTELALRMRNPSLPVLIAFVLAACALLVPPPTADYAVLSLDGKKPLMSAETALVAAGVVFGVLLLPVYALALDVGHARDQRQLLDRLHLTTPLPGPVLPAGRMLAGLVFVLLTALLSLLVVSSTVLARYDGVASASAAALFLLIVTPVGLFAALLGAVLDRFLADRNGARAALTFCIWFAMMGLSVAARWDLFGMSYLTGATSTEGHVPALSVGLVAARGLPSTAWTSVPWVPGFVPVRLGLILGMMAAVGGLAFLLRPTLASALSTSSRPPTSAAPTQAHWVLPSRLTPALTPTASVLTTARVVAGRWLGRSRLAGALLALVLVLALGPGTPGAALAVALMALMAVVSRTTPREARVAVTLELTTAALFRPSPSLLHGGLLALLAAVPLLPAFARMARVQLATAVLGLAASALWLTWTHRCVQRPLLGISTFALLWYVDVFNDVPPALDVLGLWQSSPMALMSAAAAAGVLLVLVARHDRQGAARLPGAV